MSDLARCIFEHEHFKPEPDMKAVLRGEELSQKAIDLDGKCANAFINRGMILSLLGRADEALSCFETAAKLSDRDHIPHVNMGNVF